MRAPLSDWLTTPPPPTDWLVPGLLVRGGLMVIAGDPGVGKSALIYGLSLALATGSSILSRPLPLSRVLYFDEENSEHDSRRYVSWLWRGLDCPDVSQVVENLRLERFTLSPQQRPYELMHRLTQAHKADVVVIDTATPACRILDENSNAEASLAIRQLRLVRNAGAPNCTMIVLKHARVDGQTGKRDIRGAKAWKGEADAILFHVASPGQPPSTGWRTTHLEPGKVRADGLRANLSITPEPHNGGWRLLAG